MNTKLNFRDHIISTCKTKNKMFGFISILRVSAQFRDIKAAFILFYVYVRSRCAIVWKLYKYQYKYLIEKCNVIYPYIFLSSFVAGMVGLHSLQLHRKLQLLVHYYIVLNKIIDNAAVMERIGLYVAYVFVVNLSTSRLRTNTFPI